MHVVDVAALTIGPSGSAVDQTRRVERAAEVDDAVRVELTPTFVEGNPHHDAGEEVERVEHLTKFNFVVGDGLGGAFRVGIVAADVMLRVAAGHVLPDEETHLVARVVVTRGLDLDVFAQHVESEILENLEIVDHPFFGRRGVESVRPPALVERTVLEDEFVVEHEARNTLVVFAEGGFAHRVVGADLIDDFIAVVEGNF